MTDSALVIEKAAIIGAGTMGHGIAQVAAQSGASVTLIDINQQAVDRGRQAIEKNLNKGIEKGKVTQAPWEGEGQEALNELQQEIYKVA